MGIVPISLGLCWIRGQISDLQLQADEWLPTQREQGCCSIGIPDGSDPTHSKIRTPSPALPTPASPTPPPSECYWLYSLSLCTHQSKPQVFPMLQTSRLGVRGPPLWSQLHH